MPDSPVPGLTVIAGLQLGQELGRGAATVVFMADRGGTAYAVTVSIGVATTAGPEFDPNVLLNHADQALYQSKRAGRNRITSTTLDTPHPYPTPT